MIQKTKATAVSPIKAWRVRLYTTTYLALLIIAVAPIPMVHAPIFSPSSAEAIEPNYKDYALNTMQIEYGWNKAEFACLDNIWTKESHWNPEADNKNSTAFGIAQMLGEDSPNGFVQISNGLRYIEHRYSTPCEAWKFWQRNKWY